MSSDKLVEISPFDWHELRDLYTANWPKNLVAWHTINNYVCWFRKEAIIPNLKIYSLNDSWRSDGTYVVIDRYQLFIYTLELSNDKLKRALSLIDWSKGFKVSSFLMRHRSAVLDVVHKKKLKVEYDSLTPLYYLRKEEAKKKTFHTTSGIILKSLSTDDAEAIDNEWPNKHVGSLFLVERLIKWNENIGVFNEENKLMGWCLRLQSGALGALQVRKEYMKKGIGSLLVILMSKILEHNNMDTFAFTTDRNFTSQHMFRKLGFEHIDDVFWLRTFPADAEFEWCDNKDFN